MFKRVTRGSKNTPHKLPENIQENLKEPKVDDAHLYPLVVGTIAALPISFIPYSLYWQLQGLRQCVEKGPIKDKEAPETCTGTVFYAEDAWRSAAKLILAQSAAVMTLEEFAVKSRRLYIEVALRFLEQSPFYHCSINVNEGTNNSPLASCN